MLINNLSIQIWGSLRLAIFCNYCSGWFPIWARPYNRKAIIKWSHPGDQTKIAWQCISRKMTAWYSSVCPRTSEQCNCYPIWWRRTLVLFFGAQLDLIWKLSELSSRVQPGLHDIKTKAAMIPKAVGHWHMIWKHCTPIHWSHFMFLGLAPQRQDADSSVSEFALDFGRCFALDCGWDFALDFGRNFALDFGWDFALHFGEGTAFAATLWPGTLGTFRCYLQRRDADAHVSEFALDFGWCSATL